MGRVLSTIKAAQFKQANLTLLSCYEKHPVAIASFFTSKWLAYGNFDTSCICPRILYRVRSTLVNTCLDRNNRVNEFDSIVSLFLIVVNNVIVRTTYLFLWQA